MSQSLEIRLDSALRRIMYDRHGPEGSIECIETRQSESLSSYDAHVVTLRMTDGTSWQVYIKDLGNSRYPKDHAEQRRERELYVYRDLLDGSDLGTPAFYAEVRDESSRHYWLVLEYVPGIPVLEMDEEYWIPAFGWLGRLHGQFADRFDGQEVSQYLAHHDHAFYQDRLERSCREVALAAPDLVPRWVDVAHRFEPVVNQMAALPRTLIHGDYNPRNILVDAGSEIPRISPVDWERAAVGSPYFDMALLADGFNDAVLRSMFDVYRHEAAANGLQMPENDEMLIHFNKFRLFRVVTWLSRANERGFSRGKMIELIASAESEISQDNGANGFCRGVHSV